MPNNTIPWDFKPRSVLIKRIEQSLLQDTEVNFVGSPLEEAFKYLQDLHSIEIWVDKEALEEEGINTDAPITFQMSGISLDSALNMMLEPLQLDYVIKNEVLVITTKVRAEDTLKTRVYNLSRLPHLTPKELVEIIVGGSPTNATGSGGVASETVTLIPDSKWELIDGEGGTAWAGKTTLIICQTQRVHRQIVALLDQLAEAEAVPTKTPVNAGGQPAGVKPGLPAATPVGSSGNLYGSVGTPTVPTRRPEPVPAKP